MIQLQLPNKHAIAAILLLAIAAAVGWLIYRSNSKLSPNPGATPAALSPARTDVAKSDTTAGSATAGPSTRTVDPGQVPASLQAPTGPQPATVEVHLHCADPAADRTATLRAVHEHSGEVVAEARFAALDRASVGVLSVPADRWLHIEAAINGIHLPGRRLRLGNGERHRLDLHMGAGVTSLRIRGPSAELAPHVRLHVLDRGTQPPSRFQLPLSAEGRVRCTLAGRTSAWLALSGVEDPTGGVPLRTADGAFEFGPDPASIDLEPIEAVIGITARREGQPVATVIWLGPTPLGREAALCSIATRRDAQAAPTLELATDLEALRYRGSLEAIRRASDLWAIDLEEVERLGELRVLLTTDAERARVGRLEALPWSGHATVALDDRPASAVHAAALPAGDYRLAWTQHGVPPEIAVDHLRIQAGQRTEITLAPRPLETWTIEVAGAPKGLSLGLGIGAQRVAQGDDGTLIGAMALPPVVGQRAWVSALQEKARFDAAFTAVDAAARRAVVSSTLVDAVRTRLEPVPLFDPQATRAWLLPPAEDPTEGAWHFFSNALHVLPGDTRHGYVTETIDGNEHLTCWFEVDGGSPHVAPTPAGRWATLVLPRAPSRADVICVGRAGRSKRLRIRANGSSTRIYVARGTQSIRVEFEGTQRTFESALREFVVR